MRTEKELLQKISIESITCAVKEQLKRSEPPDKEFLNTNIEFSLREKRVISRSVCVADRICLS